MRLKLSEDGEKRLRRKKIERDRKEARGKYEIKFENERKYKKRISEERT